MRCLDDLMDADALAADSEDLGAAAVLIVNPNNPLRRKKLHSEKRVELLQSIVNTGEIVYDFPSLEKIRNHRKEQLAHLHESYKRLLNPHTYKVGVTPKLWKQKEEILKRLSRSQEPGNQ